MGYLKQRHGCIMPGKTPEGTCPECAVAHELGMPHNKQSLAYQYHFYDQHGRWPTWEDAMAHCTEEVQQHWRRELELRGVKLDG